MKRVLFLLSALFFTNNAFSDPINYSEAVAAGDLVYVSGQVPIDPITGKMMDGDIETLTDVVIDYIQHWLHVKGLNMNQVVKTQVFLADIRDFDGMDAAYGKRFNFSFPPARDVVAVGGLRNNAKIEISCVAYKKR